MIYEYSCVPNTASDWSAVFVGSVSLSAPIKAALISVRRLLSQFGYRMKTFSARRMSVIQGAKLESFITSLSLNDLNRILFRCDGEERDDGKNFGAYNLAFYGDLKYCGLQGNTSSVVFRTALFVRMTS